MNMFVVVGRRRSDISGKRGDSRGSICRRSPEEGILLRLICRGQSLADHRGGKPSGSRTLLGCLDGIPVVLTGSVGRCVRTSCSSALGAGDQEGGGED